MRTVSIVILVCLLLPSGVQAGKLLNYCMTDMTGHEMMNDSHDCCLPDENGQAESIPGHQNCDSELLCVCSGDEVPAEDQRRIPSTYSSAVILSQTGFHFTVISPDEVVHNGLTPVSYHHNPPLYLLYDTFLN